MSERILLIRLSALGDVIHALAAHRMLRLARPDARIDWLVEDRFAPLVERVEGVDGVVVFPRGALRRPTPRAAAAFLRHAAAITRTRYDVAIDLHGNLKSGLHLRATGAPRRIGLAAGAARESAHRFANEHVAPPRDAHRSRRAMELLRPLGLAPPPRDPRPGGVETVPRELWPVFRPDEELDPVARRALPDGDAPRVLLHPGTSAFGAFKRLPPETFGAVAEALRTQGPVRIHVTHGPGEEALAARTAAAAGGDVATLAPGGGLRGLVAHLRRADLVIAADSGPLLLASALGVRTVALFGPKDPAVYAPPYAPAEVVTHEVPCRPCSLRRCGDPVCMTAMSPTAIAAAAARALGAATPT